ncbi:hypothetical protein [Pantoea sp. BAV 3049]|uniref:hypothetical protein n=1 Tax=Pantoea sp. BAV 3049 TaxID=2654188 RepID=UPI001E4FDA0B|nr:hypothetical protein [Pantoea sp. BAV 3049]
MQVDIHQTGAGSSTLQTRQAATAQPLDKATTLTARTAAAANSYPDRPLISSQPLRYNVQLNEQLTAVQQADSFLQSAEKQVLQLVHALTRRDAQGEVRERSENLQQLLMQRDSLSGGYVDRQLQLNLQSKPLVNFSLQDGTALVNRSEQEVLTFSLGGRQREVSAASLEENASPRHNLLRLNQALGKWGIQGKLDAQDRLNFQVDEQRWPQVSQHLSVQGGGERYPQGQFFPVKPQVESGLEEALTQLNRTPSQGGQILPELEKALETLTQQRRSLQQTRERAQQRIDSMATFSGRSSALQAASDFSATLLAGDFTTLTQALAGQANLSATRVRNVLNAR